MWLIPVWATFWSSLYYLFMKCNSKCSHEWNSRVIAMVHALLSTRIVETSLIFGPWIFDAIGEPNSVMQTFVVNCSSGYFVFEITWCFYMKTEGPVMLLHHFISVTSLIFCLYTGKSGSEVSAVLWGSELTNPFLQIRWFLREINLYHTTFAYINDIVFILIFALARIFIGTFLAYYLYFSTNSHILLKIGGYVFYLIGFLWMYQIIRFARKRFLKISK